MDERFFLPLAVMAMPRACLLGLSNRILSSRIVLIRPSELEFNHIFASPVFWLIFQTSIQF